MTEERLKQAARQAGQAIIDSLPAPEDCTHTFSLDFQRKMKRLLRRANHPRSRPALRVACMLLVCLLGCGTFFRVNAEAREIFLGWVSRLEEGAQHYFFSGEPTANDPVPYILPEVPEGYQEVSRNTTYSDFCVTYANAAGQIFEFGYIQNAEESPDDIFFIAENAEKQSASIHGMPADLYIEKNEDVANLIVWWDEETSMLFYISAYLDETDLISLAESVRQVS